VEVPHCGWHWLHLTSLRPWPYMYVYIYGVVEEAGTTISIFCYTFLQGKYWVYIQDNRLLCRNTSEKITVGYSVTFLTTWDRNLNLRRREISVSQLDLGTDTSFCIDGDSPSEDITKGFLKKTSIAESQTSQSSDLHQISYSGGKGPDICYPDVDKFVYITPNYAAAVSFHVRSTSWYYSSLCNLCT
jgi:hypothetical protein